MIFPVVRYLSITHAAFFPSAIAPITVSAPLLKSPPPNTPARPVANVFSSASTDFHLVKHTFPSGESTQSMSDFWPIANITALASIVNSEPLTGSGLLLPEASGSPRSIFTHSIPVALPFLSVMTFVGFVRNAILMPSACASSIST